jgi:pectate lyase
MTGQKAFVEYNSSAAPSQFDAYVATTRNEVLSAQIKALQGEELIIILILILLLH